MNARGGRRRRRPANEADRLDRALELAQYHGRPSHICDRCEVEVLRAMLAIIGAALVSGRLVWTGPELEA